MNATLVKWVLIISGALTMTMLYAAVAPESVARSTFGESLEGAAADLVVRNWGVLIALVGAMLIYGAYQPAVRPLVVTVAAVSKIVFIALMVSHGGQFLRGNGGMAVVIDSIEVAFFVAYLATTRRAAVPAAS